MVCLRPVSMSRVAGGYHSGQRKSRASLKNEGHFQASNIFTPCFQSVSSRHCEDKPESPKPCCPQSITGPGADAMGSTNPGVNLPQCQGNWASPFPTAKSARVPTTTRGTVSHIITSTDPSLSSRGAMGSSPAPQCQVVLFGWVGGGGCCIAVPELFSKEMNSYSCPWGFCEAYLPGGCKWGWEDD